MVFFRSEEALQSWCRDARQARRPCLGLPTLWRLAEAWYGSRLQPDWRRFEAAEVRQLFDRLGMVDPFWDPATNHN
ncbi:MAG: hypothetical protein AAF604_00915 [Acidobacteriota bacterium]